MTASPTRCQGRYAAGVTRRRLRRLVVVLALLGALAAALRARLRGRETAEPGLDWPGPSSPPGPRAPSRPSGNGERGTAPDPAPVTPGRRAGAGTKPGGVTRPPGPATGDRPSRPPASPPPPRPEPLLWVQPSGGVCPPSHPVKAKLESGIFHVPGGRFYERTRPDRCYADEQGAEADGLRRSKQ